MKFRAVSGIVFTIIVTIAFSVAQGNEQAVQLSELPPAVRAAVQHQSSGATVRGFSKERENGETYYEAELKVKGHNKDVLMDSGGTVVEVEEEVAFRSLPARVQSGLRKQASGGRIVKVESVTKKDKLVAYEAQVVKHGKRSELQVGPEGEALKQAE